MKEGALSVELISVARTPMQGWHRFGVDLRWGQAQSEVWVGASSCRTRGVSECESKVRIMGRTVC